MGIKEVRDFLNTKRRDFSNKPLDDKSVKENPFEQYAVWFKEAMEANVPDPYAACLSTVNSQNEPSSRMIYIRDILENGFVFYTNYESNKAKDLDQNSAAALNIYWIDLERQIRIKGNICKVEAELSDSYFKNRPRKSQIGAWASAQSNKIESREVLARKIKEIEAEFNGKEVTRPPFWGGYQLIAEKIEFWQGRPSRLHDRILYTKENNSWRKNRLSP
jgi:pyridoxamine 5'-phosphate oxidase